jgi:glycosyltransferase involved in cell wall biosynthesis
MPALERNPSARGLLMLGGLHWPPNADAVRWFSREIWPLVSEQAPWARLFVVGARPSEDIRALGDFAGIERPEQAGDAHVVVTGYVPDPAPFIRESAALIVALRSGGGMRVKIVEALQWGLPVISTTVGYEGIDVTPGRDVLVADEPRAFAQAAVTVLSDKGLAQHLSRNGRQLVEQRYDWRTAYTVLEAVYGRA